jgi:energy-coupling factor transporter ATP-binding protein EcfA2
MQNGSYHLFKDKVVMRVRNQVCNNSQELLNSEVFNAVLFRYLKDLKKQRSKLLGIFKTQDFDRGTINQLKQTLLLLATLPSKHVIKLVEGSEQYFRDPFLFNEFVEQLYNFWRRLHRLVICDSVFDRLDKRPYRTFNDMVESLMHIVRSTYRNIQENITGNHPKIYRQLSAGAEIGAIALPKELAFPVGIYGALKDIFVIRQVLIYPPMIFNTPNNRRKGMFVRSEQNPLDNLKLKSEDWLAYPAKVGPLLIMVYFPLDFFELSFALCNLFELADEEDLQRKPDAVYIFGTPVDEAIKVNGNETVFYEDKENDILIASIPLRDEYAYFGYLKKMILTLHNIKRMKDGYLPFHGAMVQITVRGRKPFTVVVIGDSGAGKSETIEALRQIATDEVDDILIIADDMGSLEISPDGKILGYGTEMGAFVRLDDLQAGYALGQIDRTIIMNPDQVNARVVMPVTSYEYIVQGTPVDCVLYANNYELVDSKHPAIEQFFSSNEALGVFRQGAVMSKGTTTSTGLVKNYFANIFGPPQYKDMHEPLAKKFFETFFTEGLFVGQLRTMLGIPGKEHSGPENAAGELLKMIKGK